MRCWSAIAITAVFTWLMPTHVVRADYITGQCVSCPRCPPCSGGGGGGSSGGGGVPLLFYLIFGDAVLPKADRAPPPPPKPEYPEAFRAFDQAGEDAKNELGSLLIANQPQLGTLKIPQREDKEYGAKMVTQSLVTGAGTTIFANPGGGDARFAPNPPMIELRVPSGPRVQITDSVEQLGYAMAITRLANATKGLSVEDQRFLLDQAGSMLTGTPVQLDLSAVRSEPATDSGLDAVKELFELKWEHREDRVEVMQSLAEAANESAPYDRKRDDIIRAAGYDPEGYPDPLPDTPEFKRLDAKVSELTSTYARYLEKDKVLRKEYREKAEKVLKQNETVGFYFGTAILTGRAKPPSPPPPPPKSKARQ